MTPEKVFKNQIFAPEHEADPELCASVTQPVFILIRWFAGCLLLGVRWAVN